MPRNPAQLYVTRVMGRNWMGCEHGRPSLNPHLCRECFLAAVHDAQEPSAHRNEITPYDASALRKD